MEISEFTILLQFNSIIQIYLLFAKYLQKLKYKLFVNFFIFKATRQMLRFSNLLNHVKYQKLSFPISASFSNQSKQVPRDYSPPVKTKFQIIGRDQINHNCYIFKFKFDGPEFQLKMGQHYRITEKVITQAHPEGQQVSKFYTPITTINQFENGKINTLIKVYTPQLPSFLGGRLGNHLLKLKTGDKINVEGPFGKFAYEAPGTISVCDQNSSTTKRVSTVKRIFFIAAGTGLTPIYQTLHSIVNNPNDKTEVILLFLNRSQEDIILSKQLEAMQPRIKLIYSLDSPPTGWKGLTGRVNPQLLNSVVQLTDKQTYYVSCGPSQFTKAMTKIFSKYPDSKYFKF